MNDLMKRFGMTEYRGVPVVSSRKVAEVFNKEHKDVLETIRNALQTLDDTDEDTAEFSAMNFQESSYKVRGRKFPEYLLTRDGFTLVTMGYGGKRAMKFKVAYINKFNEMERFIQSLYAAKMEFPEFTEAIMSAHEEPKHYHFSNELNMINKIVLGMNAKQFKEAHGLKDVSSIRPYLTTEQINSIERLQKFDTGLIYTETDFQKRKAILCDYHHRVNEIKALKRLA